MVEAEEEREEKLPFTNGLVFIRVFCFQKGVVRGTQLALDYMGKHKGGKGGAVVNIASVSGLGKKSACPVYDGTKFFVVGYSQSISVSFKDHFYLIVTCV
jgi:short-subunit dehydrogenase